MPQIAPANRNILRGLVTAVSSKKTEWLDEAVKLIEDQHSKKEMSDNEYQTLMNIVNKAKSGDWSTAQKEAFALLDGQKATPEELNKIKPPSATN